MCNLKVNETPVRTSRNFLINNMKLECVEIPEVIEEFNNVQVIKKSENIEINSNINCASLNYGLGESLTNLVNEKSNYRLKFIVNDKKENTNQINFKFDNKNRALVENVEIVASENSKSSIIIKYESDGEQEYFHDGILKVLAKENSELNVIIVNLLNTKSNNFIAIENIFEENAKVNYTIIDFGGKNSITNYYSNLIGKKADNNLNTIYLGKENQLFDLNYIGELRGEKTNINIEVQGALKDSAKKHFKGTIDFKKGCKKAKGNENEFCILLSDKAKSIALPMLLCTEDDVEGNHSTASGKVKAQDLFYIMSRGIEYKEAIKLLVRANFNKILENVENNELKEQILEEIDKRLD